MDAPRRILILDDEPESLELTKNHLRAHSYEPLPTSRWTEALNLITHECPDLLLLDIQMPTVQGDTLLEFIREEGYELPVIVVSDNLNEGKMADLRRLGVNEFVSKPYGLDNLNDYIRKMFEQFNPPDSVQEDMTSIPIEPSFDNPDTNAPQFPTPPGIDEVEPASEPAPRMVRKSHHYKSRKLRKIKAYSVITMACLIVSLAIVLIEKLPDLVSHKAEQLVEKTIQSEMSHGIQGLSQKEKDNLRKSFDK